MRLGILCIVILGLAMSVPSGVFADLHDGGGAVGSYWSGDDGSSGNYHPMADTGVTFTVATPEVPRSGESAGIGSAPIADFVSPGKTTTTALFTWTQAVNATALSIEQSSNGGISWSGATHGLIAPTAVSATVNGLSPGTLYRFRLAVTGGENAGISNVVSVTTDAAPPILSSAITTMDGTRIILSFNKIMADPVGEQGSFSYSVNGVGNQTFSGVSLDVDPTRILLICNGTGIAYNSMVAVSYIAGTVSSADGGTLASFADRQVVVMMLAPIIPDGGSNSDIAVTVGVSAGSSTLLTSSLPPIESIEITTNTNLTAAIISIDRITRLPSSISPPEQEVYRYLSITPNPGTARHLNPYATIRFYLPVAYLSSIWVGTTDIAMMRYVDDRWVRLPTTFIGIKRDLAIYEAETPGFSLFAIVVMRNGAVVAAPTRLPTTAPTPEPVEIIEEKEAVIIAAEPTPIPTPLPTPDGAASEPFITPFISAVIAAAVTSGLFILYNRWRRKPPET